MDPIWEAFTGPLLAAVAVLVVHFLSRGRFAVLGQEIRAVRQDVDLLRDDVNRRFDEAKADRDRRFDEAKADRDRRFDEAKADRDMIRRDVAALRSDVTAIALAVDPHHGERAG